MAANRTESTEVPFESMRGLGTVSGRMTGICTLQYLLYGWIKIPQVIKMVGAVATRCYIPFVANGKPTAYTRLAPSNEPSVVQRSVAGIILPNRPVVGHRPAVM